MGDSAYIKPAAAPVDRDILGSSEMGKPTYMEYSYGDDGSGSSPPTSASDRASARNSVGDGDVSTAVNAEFDSVNNSRDLTTSWSTPAETESDGTSSTGESSEMTSSGEESSSTAQSMLSGSLDYSSDSNTDVASDYHSDLKYGMDDITGDVDRESDVT